MESHDHTYDHIYIRGSFWRFVEADFKNLFLFHYSIEDFR